MASGRLGTANLAATTVTDVYTVPSSKVASFTASFCNRNATQVTVRAALSDTTVTQGTDEYLAYDTVIPANSFLQIGGIVLAATQIFTAYASATGVSVVCFGYEEAA